MLSNTHFSIAVHIMSALAYSRGAVIGSEHLARTVGTNPSFLRGLIGQLRDGGLVETKLGKGGGTLLARDPEKISLRDIYQATESKPAMNTHTCDGRSPCPVARNMERVFTNLNARLEGVVGDELSKTTLADLVKDFIEKAG